MNFGFHWHIGDEVSILKAIYKLAHYSIVQYRLPLQYAYNHGPQQQKVISNVFDLSPIGQIIISNTSETHEY